MLLIFGTGSIQGFAKTLLLGVVVSMFTAIMVTWLARFNPFAMVGTATLVAFVTRGMAQVQKAFGITNSAIGSISIGIIYFTVIAVEFLISYRIVFNHHSKKEKDKQLPQGKEDK